jgi:putative ATP-dependent DNA ligase
MPVLITGKLLSDARKKGRLEERNEELDYWRFREDTGKVMRGTVIIGNRVISGFPHIKRIFTLEKGITRNMKSEILYAEQKMDGYNLRIAAINKRIYAFSRGGFIDYFATEKARDLVSAKFFADFPNYALCCEMLGNTPYTRPGKDGEVKMYIFDIDDGNGNYVPCEEKYSLLKKYGIPSVPQMGKFSAHDIKKIKELALSLLRGKKEGMVLKSADRSEAVKYVTPFADIDDIANNTHLMFDMPSGFFIQRVLRSAFFIKDFGLDKEKFQAELGKAFYEKFISSLNALENGEGIGEEFEITIKDKKIWEWIKRHMSKEVKLEKLSEREENGKTSIVFRKIYKKSDRKLREHLSGKGVTD